MDHSRLEVALRDLRAASTLLDLWLLHGQETTWSRLNYQTWSDDGCVVGYLSEQIEQHVAEAVRAFFGEEAAEAADD